MSAVTSRGPSPLQRRVLIVLAALDEKRPGPVLTRDIERVLERSGEAPVYGPNLRASCRRMEASGWLRTLRAPNLQLAVELTDAGRAVAQPLLLAEQDRLRAEQRAAEVVVLPLVPAAGLPADGTSATDLAVELNGMTYQACRGDSFNGIVHFWDADWIASHTTFFTTSSVGNTLRFLIAWRITLFSDSMAFVV